MITGQELDSYWACLPSSFGWRFIRTMQKEAVEAFSNQKGLMGAQSAPGGSCRS